MKSLCDLTFSALESTLAHAGHKPIHAARLWSALHRELLPEKQLVSLPGLPAPLRGWLADLNPPPEPVELRRLASQDGQTRKFLLRLQDGAVIETVLMGYPGRQTACLSTQAGCAMGCVFCATGQQGFTRHLSPGEITAQVRHLQRLLREENAPPLRNLVLMGMGEPLHNFAAVMDALTILTDTRGCNFGPSRITLSTVGHVPGIRRLAREPFRCHLAVSLHAATQSGRAALIPAAQRWPLDELLDACREYTRLTGRKIFLEWTLIAGTNDAESDAAAVAALFQDIPCHVNLIPLNPTPAYAGTAAARSAAWAFQRVLRASGIPSTLRQYRGIDVAAGCGQLAGL
jgi:23S rRNA (adenine2503-C2)-methyltransferase